MQSIRDWLDQPVIPSEVLPFAIIGGLLILALAGLAGVLPKARQATADDPHHTGGFLSRWFRTMRLGRVEGVLVRTIFAAFAVLFLMAIATAFVLVGGVLWQAMTAPTDGSPSASLGLGALLVALLGAPFLIWRTLVAQRTPEATQRQTQLQEESHFNDKINAAATDLAARRQVTRVAKGEDGKPVLKDGAQIILTEWQDDLVTRAAAIDRLEGLAMETMERGDYAPAQRIARMLSIYVRELSETNRPLQPPVDIWDALAAGSDDQRPLNGHEIHALTGILPDDVSEDGSLQWAKALRPARRDMERATQSLGRIIPVDTYQRAAFNPEIVNLSLCNLQGMDLRGLNFAGALFRDASLVRSRLSGSSFEGADLRRADLRWADLGPSDW